MHPSFVRDHRTATSASDLQRIWRALLIALLFANIAWGQNIRPDPGGGVIALPGGGGLVPINPGGGGGGGPGGGVIIGGGGVIIGGGGLPFPIFPINPGGGPTFIGPQIVTDNGMLTGQTLQASVIVPDEPPTAAAPTQSPGATTAPSATTYQWSISGGRITSDPTKESIRFTADAAGSVTLNVVILARGTGQSASTQVTVLSPALAGTITSPSTARAGAAPLTATVPAAQNADRTFRWSVAGNGAAIMSGQGTNTVTLRPGTPGLLEVMCDVTLQRLATATVRSFVVVTGEGAPVALTINRGDGGGTYPAGSRVDIFAEPPSPGEVFDKWVGTTAILGDAPFALTSPHAVVTLPSGPAALTATYRAVSRWTPTTVNNFNPIAQTSPGGTTLVYHVPADAKGMVFLLHKTGDTAMSWFTTPEQLTLARALVAAGYGVAALSSANRITGDWNVQPTLNSNPDGVTLAAALDRLVNLGSVTASTPVFLLGIGNGGDAAARFAQQLATASPARPIKGAVAYCAASSATVAVTSRVPQLFALTTHDESLGATGNIEARANSQLLAGRGIATAVVTNATSPIPAGRLRVLGQTVDGFTATDAQAIWTALKTAGLLDANNYPKSVPTVDAIRAALPTALKSRAADVVTQLAVAFGAEEFYSDANAQVIAFLDAQVAATPAREPGRLANVSTRTSIEYLGDTITLGFTLAGTQPTTLLIRGIGPSLTRFGIADALPAPRLTVTRGGTLIASNESWDTAPRNAQLVSAAAAVGAFALTRGSLDTAVLVTLEPGAYSATITSINGAVGGVLAEIYDVSSNATRLTNVSTLAKIGADGQPLFPAIVVAGNMPRTLVVRAVGPGLADFGLPSNTLLADPRLVILNRAGQVVATNNNWTQTAAGTDTTMLNTVFAAAGAFPLKPANADAALVTAFMPGSYMLQTAAAPIIANPFAQLSSTVGTTGAVLVEVFEVP